MERRAEIGSNHWQALLKRCQGPTRYLQQVRLPEVFVHAAQITRFGLAIQGRNRVDLALDHGGVGLATPSRPRPRAGWQGEVRPDSVRSPILILNLTNSACGV